MESESLLRRVAAPVQLPLTHKETKESQTENIAVDPPSGTVVNWFGEPVRINWS